MNIISSIFKLILSGYHRYHENIPVTACLNFFKLNCVFNVFIRFLCSFTIIQVPEKNIELAIIRVWYIIFLRISWS